MGCNGHECREQSDSRTITARMLSLTSINPDTLAHGCGIHTCVAQRCKGVGRAHKLRHNMWRQHILPDDNEVRRNKQEGGYSVWLAAAVVTDQW